MFECIHGDTGNTKTEKNEFQCIPEILEVGTSLFLHLTYAADEEIQGKTAIQDLKEDHHNTESAYIALQPEYLEKIKETFSHLDFNITYLEGINTDN